MEKKYKQYNQVFLESYTQDFPMIIKSHKGVNYAYCTMCRSDIKISHGGKRDIKDHLKTKKHCDYVKIQEKTPKIGTFFDAGGTDNEVINAECLFASFIIEHNLPIAVADHASLIFKKMFPKCDVAKRFACGRTKMTAIIKEMAVDCKKTFEENVKNSVFALSIDGSNDTDSQLYPIVITFLNEQEGKIQSTLFALPALSGNSTGQNIGDLMLNTLKARNVDVKKCIAFGADNAPVMIGNKNGVAAILKKENKDLIVMGCPCHLIHLAAEKAAKSLPVAVDDVLIDIFYYLERSSKRKEELKELQKKFDAESHKILKHVCTRWLSLGRSLKRLLEQWDVLASFFKNQIKRDDHTEKMSSLEGYRIPKIKPTSNDASKKRASSFSSEQTSKKVKIDSVHATVSKTTEPKNMTLNREERLLMFLSSDLNRAYCLFLDYIIPSFEKTNVILQSEAPKIHILNSLLLNLFKEILCKFVKPEVIKSSPLIKIKYGELNHQKNDNDLAIGCATVKVVNTLKNSEKNEFYSAVRHYFITCCNYMRLKLPINSDVLKHAEVADLNQITKRSFMDVQYFLDRYPITLQEKDESQEEAIDKLQNQFCELQIDDLPADVVNEERMDKKWAILGKQKAVDGSFKYNKIANIMLSILTIPHSNAECERIFSTVRKTRTDFRSSLSNENLENILIAKTKIGPCYQQNFCKEFLVKAKSATYKHLTENKS